MTSTTNEYHLRASGADHPAGTVTDGILRALGKQVHFDLAALLQTDPATMLPAGGTVVGFSPSDCAPFWDNEYLDPDVNKFADLAHRDDPIATLVGTLGEALHRSTRYVKMLSRAKTSDEMRIAFVSGRTCLGVAALIRCDRAAYAPNDVTRVRSILPSAVAELQRSQSNVSARAGLDQATESRLPATFLLDADGEVSTLTAGSGALIDDLRVNKTGDHPGLLWVAAERLRSDPSAADITTRLYGRSGSIYRLYVSRAAAPADAVVVTVEAAGAGDLAAIVLESYALTSRETEITLSLCRGLSAKQIAAELFLSTHTVRDYMKVIYEKAGVNSRGELMAQLFTNHVVGGLEASVSTLSHV